VILAMILGVILLIVVILARICVISGRMFVVLARVCVISGRILLFCVDFLCDFADCDDSG